MGEKLVVLGNKSDHGGTMISATGTYTVDGIKGCVTGDQHNCPIRGHGVTPVTGTAKATNGGKKLARNNDKAGCGAKIIGTGSSVAD